MFNFFSVYFGVLNIVQKAIFILSAYGHFVKNVESWSLREAYQRVKYFLTIQA